MADDIITAEERETFKRLFAETENPRCGKPCKDALSSALSAGRRTLAALEAAEAEIERLRQRRSELDAENAGLRQRANKSEEEVNRLRNLFFRSHGFTHSQFKQWEEASQRAEKAEAEVSRITAVAVERLNKLERAKWDADKFEAENARLRELCGEGASFVNWTRCYLSIGQTVPKSFGDLEDRLRAAAEGKGTGFTIKGSGMNHDKHELLYLLEKIKAKSQGYGEYRTLDDDDEYEMCLQLERDGLIRQCREPETDDDDTFRWWKVKD